MASTVHQIRGHIKGRTLLPFPQQGAAAIEDEEIRVRTSDGRRVNMMTKNAIEGIILKWAHQVSYNNPDSYLVTCDDPSINQVEEVLAKDSAKVLEDGDNPGPLEEIQFWESKRVNLESLFEQMKAKTTRHMASILNVTDSAYYPCFK